MKVIHKNRVQAREKAKLTLRLDSETLKRIDDICKKSKVSRQVVIENIVKQATVDPNFVLEIR